MKKHRNGVRIRTILAVILLMLTLAFGFLYVGGKDYLEVLKFWLTVLLIGLSCTPFTITLFQRFHDAGWIFGKTIALGISGWLMWLLSSLHILKFTRLNSILIVILCFVLSMLYYTYAVQKKNRNKSFKELFPVEKHSAALISEVIFLAVLTYWCYLKTMNPAAYGTERMMDYSFMQTIFNTEYMPPNDVWFSGEGINYYYLGQYFMTYIVKVSGIPVKYGYNLAMMFLAAVDFSMCYSIGNNLMRICLKDREEEKKGSNSFWALPSVYPKYKRGPVFSFIPVFAGLFSAMAVTLAGNMHYPIYYYFRPQYLKMKNLPVENDYFFPNSTRYIGYVPDVPDKTIHEFPSYSFVLGDLHAHVINTIFVLTVLALLLAWLWERKEKADVIRQFGYPLADATPMKNRMICDIFNPKIVMAAFLVGLFYMTNTWDLAIYIVVAGAVILFSNLVLYRYRVEALLTTAFQGALFAVMVILTSAPFIARFDSIASEIRFCTEGHHTPFKQLMVLWGLPLGCFLLYLGVKIYEYIVRRKEKNKVIPMECDTEIGKPHKGLPGFLEWLETSDLYILTIGLCAGGLVLLPEIIYVRDIYDGAYQRSNTMFKLSYQAFIMFGLVMAYVLIKYLVLTKKVWVRICGLIATLLFLMTVDYFNTATEQWFNRSNKTLDATKFIAEYNGRDAEAIEYINDYVDKDSVILENNGLSYTFFERISSYTGRPTVVGWETHEWLWRSGGEANNGMPESVQKRMQDVTTIYTSSDLAEVCRLVEQYDIDYIYIGECERVDGRRKVENPYTKGEVCLGDCREIAGEYFASREINDQLLYSLGEAVFQKGDMELLFPPESEDENYPDYEGTVSEEGNGAEGYSEGTVSEEGNGAEENVVKAVLKENNGTEDSNAETAEENKIQLVQEWNIDTTEYPTYMIKINRDYTKACCGNQ